jgi:hypothetical protein
LAIVLVCAAPFLQLHDPTLGMLELGLDAGDVLPPLRTDRPESGPVVR